ncbi:MAG: nucleotidyltransferase domain-containing protein [Candidatus Diapherotrites archaeon]|nr:nucleotidyltransferase domain-containing protein [Candidatus Diapherotrites archaeon]
MVSLNLTKIGSKSKEESMLELFFNESSRHWHFEDILKKAKISRPQAMNWLRRLAKEGIIRRIKEKNKMPYYTGDFESPAYKNRKRIYALNKFYETGFLNHLLQLKAKTIILFGSFARADWNTESDIDLFIYGDAEEFEQGKYEQKLRREIQTFTCKDKKEYSRFQPGLMKSILSGYLVKGNMDFIQNA